MGYYYQHLLRQQAIINSFSLLFTYYYLLIVVLHHQVTNLFNNDTRLKILEYLEKWPANLPSRRELQSASQSNIFISQ